MSHRHRHTHTHRETQSQTETTKRAANTKIYYNCQTYGQQEILYCCRRAAVMAEICHGTGNWIEIWETNRVREVERIGE